MSVYNKINILNNKTNQFSSNVPFTDTPSNWFLLAKCQPSTGVFQTFC